MCSVCIFCGSPSFLGKINKYINRSVVWRRFYSLLAFLLREQPWTLTSFYSSIDKWGPLFLQRSWDPIRLKIIVVVSEGAKVLDICTTLLPDLASVGSPLFAEPMFFFGWALCNTSTYCMLAFWLSWVNFYALRGNFHYSMDSYKIFFTYALFWLPKVNISLKKQLPYFTISFSWNKRLLEPTILCDECSVNLYNFFWRR